MNKVLVLVVMGLIVSFSTLALAFDKDSIEVFNKKGTIYVLRDTDGTFITWAKIKIEEWEGRDLPVFVVRDKQGRFLTHGNGEVESYSDDSCNLVLRQFDGRFIAHTEIDPEFCY